MSASTSGMPFAVTRAAHQPDDKAVGLSSLFGLGGKTHSPGSGGGAWTSAHAQQSPGLAGAGSGGVAAPPAPAPAAAVDSNGAGPAGGKGADGFVPLPALQRGATGELGTLCVAGIRDAPAPWGPPVWRSVLSCLAPLKRASCSVGDATRRGGRVGWRVAVAVRRRGHGVAGVAAAGAHHAGPGGRRVPGHGGAHGRHRPRQ